MRRHLYLVVSHPDDDLEGCVEAREKRYHTAEKNTETRVDKRNVETGEGFTIRVVSLGYHDFDGEDDYEDRFGDVAKEKLGEIDAEHLEAAGLTPSEVVA